MEQDVSREQLKDLIFSVQSKDEFEKVALAVFRYQAERNTVYNRYLEFLKRDIKAVMKIEEITFLPVEFYKTEKVISGFRDADIVFASSTTTGAIPGRHYVPDISLYEKSFQKCFHQFYGDPENYCLLALLPSYLERKDSSLVYMMNELIKSTRHPASGFYINNHSELLAALLELKKAGQKTILVGVTFALLDFIEKHPVDFPELIVMETGGMKGRREEMVREEVHDLLSKGFGVIDIHSEYGMTELLSQAYSNGKGIFHCPPWMHVIIRDAYDPASLTIAGRSGGINIVDLANLDSCSFIETQDLGKLSPDGSFEVLGRFDNSDLRGCNLMVP